MINAGTVICFTAVTCYCNGIISIIFIKNSSILMDIITISMLFSPNSVNDLSASLHSITFNVVLFLSSSEEVPRSLNPT